MILPGLVTPQTASQLNKLAETVRMNTPEDLSQFFTQTGQLTGRIPVKVTAYDSGTGYYSWTEQSYDGAGNYVDAPNAMIGSPTVLPAVERNSIVLTSFPFYTQAWLRVAVESNESFVLEFDAGNASVTADAEMWIVQSECPIFDSTGKQIGTKVQRQKVKFPSAWLEGAVECTTNRTDCCGSGGTVTVDCCTNPILRTLYVTITGTGCTYIDGISIPLTYCSPGVLYAVEWTVKDYPLGNGSLFSGTLGCQVAVYGGWVFSLQGTSSCVLPVGGGCIDLHFGSAIGSTAILFSLGSTGDYTVVTTSCDPFILQATTNLKVTCCGGSTYVPATITITE